MRDRGSQNKQKRGRTTQRPEREGKQKPRTGADTFTKRTALPSFSPLLTFFVLIDFRLMHAP